MCFINEVDFFKVRLVAWILDAEAQLILSLLAKFFLVNCCLL